MTSYCVIILTSLTSSTKKLTVVKKLENLFVFTEEITLKQIHAYQDMCFGYDETHISVWSCTSQSRPQR